VSLSAILAVLSAFFASTTQSDPPLSIARQGYLYAGGTYDKTIPGTPMAGQVYAEFQIPAQLRHRYPVVMIHGGRQTGTNFTHTPDGRPGWAEYFLRRGYAVYVVDQVGRGRSPHWTEAYGELATPNLDFTLKRFVSTRDYKLWPQAHLHTQWPGTGQPGDPAFDNFYASQAPGIPEFAVHQKLNPPAIAALLDKIGPAILLTHSQSGSFGWPVADLRPELVKAILAVEPSGPPVHDVQMHGAPDWFSDVPHEKISGLGEVPLVYDPPITATSPLSVVRDDKPDAAGLVRCWHQQEPARTLPNLANIPVLVLTGEASYHAPYDHCTVRYLTQAGVKTTWIRLADRGIHGNGHMMMLEKNNGAIADVLLEWLEGIVLS
jgi:pimeloyl-ACP methyl ester carboxylesterase